MTPKEVHQALADNAECLCRGTVSELCANYRDGIACCRQRGHQGSHMACAGSAGPHAISSWCEVGIEPLEGLGI